MAESKIKKTPVAKALGDKQKSKVKITSQKSKVSGSTRTVRTSVKTVSKVTGLSLPVYGLDGARKGSVALPKEVFGAKINKALMAQAVRVYLVNQRQGTASTKNRGEVTGSTRKIYRQKGTGRARHGAIKAPIFVGGGIAFGPRPRNFELKLSKQMRKKALFSALSSKNAENQITVVDAVSSTGKTKEVYGMLKKLNLLQKKNNKILFVSDPVSVVARAARNIGGLNFEPVHNLNTFEVLNSNSIVLTKDAVGTIEKIFLGGSE